MSAVNPYEELYTTKSARAELTKWINHRWDLGHRFEKPVYMPHGQFNFYCWKLGMEQTIRRFTFATTMAVVEFAREGT